ncbi:hypothetical protein J7E79_30680 [Bacillus sp. ISL-40]|nr:MULTISPECIES: hypothetical protein [unclassified Bacillus (in: firmicutes)]MBT2701611.1 hypothetical protein [Bacillus sp. ISL-40]MBT2728253.1 hypothetical protein [Bacillus sp. ISL-75]MBT2743411.1 hypothetical protein [Bacillus sp. ISL-77]MBT2744750.1 hypothetical protein [Bacillus sp. ISL-77]
MLLAAKPLFTQYTKKTSTGIQTVSISIQVYIFFSSMIHNSPKGGNDK